MPVRSAGKKPRDVAGPFVDGMSNAPFRSGPFPMTPGTSADRIFGCHREAEHRQEPIARFQRSRHPIVRVTPDRRFAFLVIAPLPTRFRGMGRTNRFAPFLGRRLWVSEIADPVSEK